MSLFLMAHDLRKVYRLGSREVIALDGISLSIDRGSHVLITGASGSGKSTLLNILGLLDRPSCGRLILDGSPVDGLDDAALSAFRRRRLGFVFQFFNLVPTLSALENVALPMLLDGHALSDVRGQCAGVLQAVGMGERLDHLPHQLSGGEMQRVAVARALAGRPDLVLADEPTGNLDSRNATAIHELLARESRARGVTLLVVSHDPAAAVWSDRVVMLSDGRVTSDAPPPYSPRLS